MMRTRSIIPEKVLREIHGICLLTVIISLTLITGCKNEDEIPGDTLWFDQHTVDIPSADINLDDINFSSIDNAIGNATIVGLGEATHGTSEFWGIRQKLTKHLIEDKGFKAVLLEAPFPNMLYIDNYVVNQIGTLSEAHAKLNVWKYKEMQDMIAMIRDYNISNPGTKVHFFGYDCAFVRWERASEIVLEYLGRIDPASSGIISPYFESMNMNNAEFIYNFIASKRTEYTGLSSIDEYRKIYLIAKNLPASVTHLEIFNSGADATGYRDEFNFGTVQFIQDSLLNGGKVIIWAHNAHIGKGLVPTDNDVSMWPLLGSRLNEKYSEKYFNICTEFYSGKFWSWDECDGHEYTFKLFNATPPTTKYYVYYLSKSKKESFFMNFKTIDLTDQHAEWLSNENKIHVYGGVFCPGNDTGYVYAQKISITKYFDAIFFFKNTNPTTYLSNLGN
jgi:erythromycin esterase